MGMEVKSWYLGQQKKNKPQLIPPTEVTTFSYDPGNWLNQHQSLRPPHYLMFCEGITLAPEREASWGP